ncbi:MAG: hypothetical protein EXQ48_02495 [Acidobacteria bacterium]|nr:hypothetical protein [Acidobacteriota bacterium]
MTDHDVTGDLSGTYLKKRDVEDESLMLTIASVDKVTFEARNGKPTESKWAVAFTGDPIRKLTLNKTNLSLLAKGFGKRTGNWIGQTVEVYFDETVSFGGELIGGIRVRVPKLSRRTTTAPAAELPADTAGF